MSMALVHAMLYQNPIYDYHVYAFYMWLKNPLVTERRPLLSHSSHILDHAHPSFAILVLCSMLSCHTFNNY